MKLTPLGIAGAWLGESPVWSDDRGSFREWFRAADLKAATGTEFLVQQANVSTSARGVLRGIHYSLASEGQAKWVTCVSGSIKDVIVDIRPKSATFGRYVSVDLVSGDGKAVLIGNGLGHGFVSHENGTTVAYLVSSPFSPSEEFEINPLDPVLGIEWGLAIKELTLSPKDAAAPSLDQRGAQGKLPL
jgi:dTDP-4-dehydrorhamnose 3,5-epimerase